MTELVKPSPGIGGAQSPSDSPTILTAAPKVTGLHPKLADIIPGAIAEAKERGLDVGMFNGLRVEADQEKLYALGRTVKNPDGFDPEKKPLGNIVTNALPWQSWHFFGLAVDFAFKNSKGAWYWPADDAPQWEALAKVMLMHTGVAWGGNWTKFPDLPHFQMTGKIPSVREAKRILFEEGQDKLWAMV